MGIKVCKFGGTSLADADQIRKVKDIVASDPDRRFVVPSAPGKRFDKDQKITDLLYLCHEHARQGITYEDVFNLIVDRYQQIANDLDLDLDLTPPLEEVRQKIAEEGSDYAASRGEAINGLIIAKILGYTYVDSAEIVKFDANGRFDSEGTQAAVNERLSTLENAVVPGFYGSQPDGRIKTFSRGGSDITGAIVARGVEAEVYENWTDVSGLLMCDPRIVENPNEIESVTYAELRELAYMGASVLHDEAIFPVRQAGIPVNIRNTNEPGAKGTMIVAEEAEIKSGAITGIAGRKDFTVIAIAKALMNQELGFGRRLLSALETNGVSFEHLPSGIDTMSVVIADNQLDGKLDNLLADIRAECKPDNVVVYPNMSLIATVGRGMSRHPGMASRLFAALADADINIRMIDQGSGELNIIVGVEADDFENAVHAIYKAFVA